MVHAPGTHSECTEVHHLPSLADLHLRSLATGDTDPPSLVAQVPLSPVLHLLSLGLIIQVPVTTHTMVEVGMVDRRPRSRVREVQEDFGPQEGLEGRLSRWGSLVLSHTSRGVGIRASIMGIMGIMDIMVLAHRRRSRVLLEGGEYLGELGGCAVINEARE
ncbi:hypothetical protein NMY22_g7050 [Coprinellus aureogranulatus]|nr:hypothetical protein NMY22_g7050 [Coprinellus aureogranulatus]